MPSRCSDRAIETPGIAAATLFHILNIWEFKIQISYGRWLTLKMQKQNHKHEKWFKVCRDTGKVSGWKNL